MIVLNEKMCTVNRGLSVISVEMHTRTEKIIADIMSYLATEDPNVFVRGTSSILYVSGDSKNTQELIISQEYFESPIYHLANKEVTIRTISAYHLEANEALLDIKFFQNYDIVIIGMINCISERTFDNIRILNGGKRIYIFGDPLVESNDHNNYCMRYLTIANMNMRLDNSDTSRISDKKRLNVCLTKLRKQKLSIINDIRTVPGCIDVDFSNTTISIAKIREYLADNESAVVVLPKRFISSINSYLKSTQSLHFNSGDVLYNKYPYTYMEEGKAVTIPILSTITIMNTEEEVEINGRACMICNIMISYNNDITTINRLIPRATIDFTSYIMNFDRYNHLSMNDYFNSAIDLLDEYNELSNKLDSTVLSLIPYKIISPDVVKYTNTSSTLGYIEGMSRSLIYNAEINYYKYFCKTNDMIHIIYADEFDQII